MRMARSSWNLGGGAVAHDQAADSKATWSPFDAVVWHRRVEAVFAPMPNFSTVPPPCAFGVCHTLGAFEPCCAFSCVALSEPVAPDSQHHIGGLTEP